MAGQSALHPQLSQVFSPRPAVQRAAVDTRGPRRRQATDAVPISASNMFIDLPQHGTRMFAVVNPTDYSTPSPSTGGYPEPESGPLNPDLHTLVFIHAAFFTSAGWTPQDVQCSSGSRYRLGLTLSPTPQYTGRQATGLQVQSGRV
jgi:hypothetical protein